MAYPHITAPQWQQFAAQFPAAAAWLNRSSLESEYAHLQATPHHLKQGWQHAREAELTEHFALLTRLEEARRP